ncbi:MAG: PASTA domain-containing protein [Actinomycetota bacterium]|nr:MAG: PASTA domain-containing protein [Actinomycetota bacterium]
MGHAMKSAERRSRRLLRWYPRSWRETHEDEFAALLEDSMLDRPFWPGRSLNIAMNAMRVRSIELRGSPRRMFLATSVPIVVFVVAIDLATNGFGLFYVSGPSKGPMPYSSSKGVAYNKIPDYVSVYIGPNEIGYTPKAYIAASNGSSNDPLLGRIAPVYASNLTTLLGHEYPGIGFVRLGSSPWSISCKSESTYVNNPHGGQTITAIACPSATMVLPNVLGMVTPTAVGELSGLGVGVVVQNVRTTSVPPGHIVSTSPESGTTIRARQQVVVDNSVAF